MIDIKGLQAIAADTDNVIFTGHVTDRIKQRELSKPNIFDVIMYGEIIEQYPNDYPYPGCLILGEDLNGAPLHIVCGTSYNKKWVVTVYLPNDEKWEEDP